MALALTASIKECQLKIKSIQIWNDAQKSNKYYDEMYSHVDAIFTAAFSHVMTLQNINIFVSDIKWSQFISMSMYV